jgi:hypothetical protein
MFSQKQHLWIIYATIKTISNNSPKFAYKLSTYVLMKFKVTPKSESKSYSYNNILKCINIKF